MKFLTLLLCAAFYASCIALVNAKHNDDNKSTKMAVKPTVAPLTSSTVAPTKAPSKLVSPTKPMIAKRSQPLTTKSSTTSAPATAEQMKLEALPLAMPATVETPQKPAELQPLAVTGFITRNGSIYEITDKNGMGQIQARQANDDDTKAEHVCNYGPVVIYSDVPCEQVTNVKVKEYETKHKVEETSDAPAAAAAQETQPTENGNENTDNKETEDKEDLTDLKKPVRRRPSKKRANKNKNIQKRKQQKNKNRISNQNNQVRYGGNKNKNNNRRRLQQQEQKRRNQQKRRRQQAQQQDNRRKWQYEDEFEEDDYDEPRKPVVRRKPNKSQRRQPERYTSDYEDY